MRAPHWLVSIPGKSPMSTGHCSTAVKPRSCLVADIATTLRTRGDHPVPLIVTHWSARTLPRPAATAPQIGQATKDRESGWTHQTLSGLMGTMVSCLRHMLTSCLTGGWISFSDAGDLLCANDAVREIMRTWGLRTKGSVGAFNAKQKGYLAYHRTHVFRGDATAVPAR